MLKFLAPSFLYAKNFQQTIIGKELQLLDGQGKVTGTSGTFPNVMGSDLTWHFWKWYRCSTDVKADLPK